MNALREGYATASASTRWDLTAVCVSQDIVSMKAGVSVSVTHRQRRQEAVLKAENNLISWDP